MLETCRTSETLWIIENPQVFNFARKSESGYRPVGPAIIISHFYKI